MDFISYSHKEVNKYMKFIYHCGVIAGNFFTPFHDDECGDGLSDH